MGEEYLILISYTINIFEDNKEHSHNEDASFVFMEMA